MAAQHAILEIGVFSAQSLARIDSLLFRDFNFRRLARGGVFVAHHCSVPQ
jgi:hypothetical protein